jgi:hypothetical protein
MPQAIRPVFSAAVAGLAGCVALGPDVCGGRGVAPPALGLVGDAVAIGVVEGAGVTVGVGCAGLAAIGTAPVGGTAAR